MVSGRVLDAVVCDLRMEQVDGFDVLAAVRKVDPTLPVLIMTAFGGVENAVEAMRRGATHYFTKPFRLDEVLLYVQRAIAERRLREENRALRQAVGDRSAYAALVGRSAPMRALYELDRARGALPRARAGARREWLRQGAGGPRAALRGPAQGRPLRRRQLHGHPQRAAGERAVRPREGQLHRRHHAAPRPLPGGGRRHALPRRDWRHGARAPGQAAARAGGRRGARGGRGCLAQGGRARGGRHAPGAGGARARGPLPPGSLLPPQRGAAARAAPARAARGHPPAGGALRRPVAQAQPPRAPRPASPPRPSPRSPPLPGPATCASWRTSSSASPSSRCRRRWTCPRSSFMRPV